MKSFFALAALFLLCVIYKSESYAKLKDAHRACKVNIDIGFHVKTPIAIVNHMNSLADCMLACMLNFNCLSINYISDTIRLIDEFSSIKSKGRCFLSSTNVKKSSLLMSIDHSNHASFTCENGIKAHDYSITTFHGTAPRQCGVIAFRHPDREFDSLSALAVRKRIIGGTKAPPYSQPWLGLLLLDQKIECGISLITRDELESSTLFGLSAGHCFVDKQKTIVSKTRLGIEFGVQDTRFLTPHIVYRQVEELVLHPEFDFEKENDVALVVFNKKVQFNDYVRPICLPVVVQSSSNIDPPAGTACLVCGYGGQKSKTGEFVASSYYPYCFASKLDRTEKMTSLLHRKDMSTCYASILDNFRYKGAYEGDSGGPVSCLVEEKFTLYGIISTLASSTNPAEVKLYLNIYARVPHYVRWIRAEMETFDSEQAKEIVTLTEKSCYVC